MTAFSSGLKVLMMSAQDTREGREEKRRGEEKKGKCKKVQRHQQPAGGVITRGDSKSFPGYL